MKRNFIPFVPFALVIVIMLIIWGCSQQVENNTNQDVPKTAIISIDGIPNEGTTNNRVVNVLVKVHNPDDEEDSFNGSVLLVNTHIQPNGVEIADSFWVYNNEETDPSRLMRNIYLPKYSSKSADKNNITSDGEWWEFFVSILLFNSENILNVYVFDPLGQLIETSEDYYVDANIPNYPLQVVLTWNTNYTDVDLHVYHYPPGSNEYDTEWYWPNAGSLMNGGYLDVDDIDGFGPEIFTLLENPSAGEYVVVVRYYWHHYVLVPTTFNIGIYRDGIRVANRSRTYWLPNEEALGDNPTHDKYMFICGIDYLSSYFSSIDYDFTSHTREQWLSDWIPSQSEDGVYDDPPGGNRFEESLLIEDPTTHVLGLVIKGVNEDGEYKKYGCGLRKTSPVFWGKYRCYMTTTHKETALGAFFTYNNRGNGTGEGSINYFNCSEIDIEFLTFCFLGQDFAQYSTHTRDSAPIGVYDGYGGVEITTSNFQSLINDSYHNEFHEWGFDWHPDSIVFYRDNIRMGVISLKSGDHVPEFPSTLRLIGWIANKWDGYELCEWEGADTFYVQRISYEPDFFDE